MKTLGCALIPILCAPGLSFFLLYFIAIDTNEVMMPEYQRSSRKFSFSLRFFPHFSINFVHCQNTLAFLTTLENTNFKISHS